MYNNFNELYIKKEVTLINLKRIFYISLVAIPVSIAHVVIFGMDLPASGGVEYSWRIGIIVCHSLLALIMALLGSFAYFFNKRTEITPLMKIVEYCAIITFFTFGVVIVVLDQLVTASITPFMIACIFIGVLFLIRPFFAVVVYIIGYLSFYIALGLTQVDQAVLLSNRVNGITVTSVGLLLSIVLWKVNKSNMLQKRLIEEQQAELIEKNKELEYLAFYDQLTGVYNRRKFEELLKNEVEKTGISDHHSCIVLVDVDSFKEINDNFGHPVGDLVLREVAGLLRDSLRKTDAVSRWGGDEFMILLTQTSLTESVALAEKIRTLLEKKEFVLKGIKLYLTASFGISPLGDNNDDFLETAYRIADEALYRAKEKGSNRVEV
jgi:diguanylate cyclase (GGDEF)-like protein